MICNDFNFFTCDKLIFSRKLCFYLSLINTGNFYIHNLMRCGEDLPFINDLNTTMHKFEIGNCNLRMCSTRDIKHVFRCMIARKATRQWSDLLVADLWCLIIFDIIIIHYGQMSRICVWRFASLACCLPSIVHICMLVNVNVPLYVLRLRNKEYYYSLKTGIVI